MISERTILVRTYECDSNSHVNNANYLNYLEHGRFEYLKDIGFNYAGAVAAGYALFVARVEIDYKRPAHFDDSLLIQTWPIKRGAVSGVIEQKITRGDDIIATAKVTWAFVTQSGKPTKIPAEFDVPGLTPSQTTSVA
jgi:acyl-CoA thioester hydrolase